MSRALRNTLYASGPAIYKRRAQHEAKLQQQLIDDKVKKYSLQPIGYEFKELIGKGAYGRVYKSRRVQDSKIVAIKVLETDAMDFDAGGLAKDSGMKDALKEIKVLRRLQESRAVNVNLFEDAFQVDSQLWIVGEYCSGGSLTTLRRAVRNRLDERHIIPIARELAKGLKSVHDSGIVHRDIKCSNVMISETGRLQIIDFGVAGILMSNLEVDKRKTVIGTPHWMPPEMQSNAQEVSHGTEVDVWAYGVTLFESAMGAPPNARTMPGPELRSRIRHQPAPRLSEDRFSSELQDLISFVLVSDPSKRPSMEQVCNQEYLLNSEEEYPTSSLRELVEKYYLWEHAGGERASLFMQGGAAQPKSLGDGDQEEEWNFSTTADFEKEQVREIIRKSMAADPNSFDPSVLTMSPPMDLDDFDLEPFDQPTARFDSLGDNSGDAPDTARLQPSRTHSDPEREYKITRGGNRLQGLFDQNSSPYQYKYGPSSDLPLRSREASPSLHERELSVSSVNGNPPVSLSDPKPGKKRETMGWKWEDNIGGGATTNDSQQPQKEMQMPNFDTEPAMPNFDTGTRAQPEFNTTSAAGNRPESTLDLDALMGSSPPKQQNASMPPMPPMPPMASMQTAPAADRPGSTLDLDALMGDGYSTGMTGTTFMSNNNMTGTTFASNNNMTGTTFASNSMTGGMGGKKAVEPSWITESAPTSTFHSASSSIAADDLDADIGYTVRPGHSYKASDASSHITLSETSTLWNASNVPGGRTTITAHPRGGPVTFPPPPNPAALVDGAPREVLLEAFTGSLGQFINALEHIEVELADGSDEESEDDGAGTSERFLTANPGSGGSGFQLGGAESETDGLGDDEQFDGSVDGDQSDTNDHDEGGAKNEASWS